ncbi:MAG: glycosyltransferase, partial [Pyramidobacter sp.]|nr:glycosyltransferase [Pyramidobacter sp.]
MPKLLIITTIQRTLRDFLLPYGDHFRSLGWQVDAMANVRDPYPVAEEHFDHFYAVDWGRNPLDPRNFGRTPRFIRELVEREKYDIVHVHTPVAAFVTRFALRKLRAAGTVKVVYTAHGFHFFKGNSPLKNFVFLNLEKLAGRWTDHLIVMNREDFSAAQTHRIVPPEHLTLMPGIGVDLSKYSAASVTADQITAVRRELGLAPEDKYILMVAEFNPGKRHRDAILALAQAQTVHLHLVFAGWGPLFEEMKELAVKAGVAERCHFLGHLEDVRPLLKGAATSVLPSEREGLPRSVMESMGILVPVIGTNIRGTQDLLENGCGKLYKVGDTCALA